MASMAYGHFDPVFSQVATDGTTLNIADLAVSGRFRPFSVCWDGEIEQSQAKPVRLSYFKS